MRLHLGAVAFLVRDYDEAIDWFEQKLSFELISDTPLGDGKRWVVVSPIGSRGTKLLLAKADGTEQAAAIGRAAGGRVAFFLHTDDFARDHGAMLEAGVVFREAPRNESYGKVAVFEDLYGNAWDLIEPKS